MECKACEIFLTGATLRVVRIKKLSVTQQSAFYSLRNFDFA